MAETSVIEKKVRAVFGAYRTNDADAFLALVHRDFRFTSPYDDAIDRDSFMERCWPGTRAITKGEVLHIATSKRSWRRWRRALSCSMLSSH